MSVFMASTAGIEGDVVPAVVVPVAVAPALVVPVVAAGAAGSIVAFVSMNRPSADFATHPVTVTSCRALSVPVPCGVALDVELCAASNTETAPAVAIERPLIRCVIRQPSFWRKVHAPPGTRCAGDAWMS
jgi:hypothetical protein